MALRVLLADESTTIKKVMQLALQDFAVEVKAVHVGLDVVEVARQFQPDIIFADVLLQKKNGYEVCGELKRDPVLRTTPVVLMWSSFMDLDEALAQECGADRRLEKPFDIENLRHVLLELVPRTHTQRLAHFLKFPATMTEPLKAEEAQKVAQKRQSAQPNVPPAPRAAPAPRPTAPPVRPPPAAPEPPALATPAKSSVVDGETRAGWNMQSFDDIDAFSAPEPSAAPAVSVDDDDDDENFSEFRIQTPSARGYTGPAASEAKTPPSLANTGLPSPGAEEGEEPWSHQDLSRFKLDLPPVTASNPEHGIELELNDDIEGMPPAPRPFSQQPHASHLGSARDEMTSIGLSDFASNTNAYGNAHSDADVDLANRSQSTNDLLLRPDEIAASSDEIAPNLTLDDDMDAGGFEFSTDDTNDATFITQNQSRVQSTFHPGVNTDFPADEVGKIPQLSSERLEQIIRAQSREIIEGVVRKIVPDLATDIIREELQRLLEDTAVRERR